MFFRHYRFYVLMLLPVHGRFSRLWRYLRVGLGFYDDKDKLMAWHRTELEKLDPMFRLQPGDKVSMDPKYPPLIDPKQRAELLEAVGRLLEVSSRPVRRRFFK